MYNCSCGYNIINNNENAILTHMYTTKHKIKTINNQLFNYKVGKEENYGIKYLDNGDGKYNDICEICYVNNIQIKFNCTHTICKSCYESILSHNLLNCPFCRTSIFNKNYIFIGDIIILERNINETLLLSYQVMDIKKNHVILYCLVDKSFNKFTKLDLYHYKIYKLSKSWIDYSIFLKTIQDLYYTQLKNEENFIYSYNIYLNELYDTYNIENFSELDNIIHAKYNHKLKRYNSLVYYDDEHEHENEYDIIFNETLVFYISHIDYENNNITIVYMEGNDKKSNSYDFNEFIKKWKLKIYTSSNYKSYYYILIHNMLKAIIYNKKNNLIPLFNV